MLCSKEKMKYLEQSRATLEDGGLSQPKQMRCFTEKDNKKQPNQMVLF